MNSQFKKGIVEMCVLVAISKEDNYGFEIVELLNVYFEVSSNTVYPILKRFTNENLCTTYLVESQSGPARKYYTITSKGRDYLKELTANYDSFIKNVNLLLKENYD